MNKTAPHLPEQEQNSSHVSVGRFSLKYIFLVLIIAILSGAASALAIEAWFLPAGYIGGEISIERTQSDENNKKPQLSQIEKQQLEQRVVQVYDQTQLLQGRYYPREAHIATGALLSSNGWTAFFTPEFKVENLQNWQLIGPEGKLRQIEKIKKDDASGIIYLKLSGTGYRVNSLYGWGQAKQNQVFWGLKQDWNKYNTFYEKKKINDKFSSIKQPQFFYNPKNSELEPSQPIFNQSGKLAGFASREKIIPSWYISGRLSNLLAEKEFTNNFPNLTGFFIEKKISQENIENTSGFLVQEYPNIQKIRKGDIILKVDNKKINSKKAARVVLDSEKPYQITLQRRQKKIKISL